MVWPMHASGVHLDIHSQVQKLCCRLVCHLAHKPVTVSGSPLTRGMVSGPQNREGPQDTEGHYTEQQQTNQVSETAELAHLWQGQPSQASSKQQHIAEAQNQSNLAISAACNTPLT